MSTAQPLDECCKVCSRVRFGEYVPLGFGHWRHWDCSAGSADWLEAYATYPTEKRSKVGDELYIFLTSANHKREGCSNETETA